MITNNDYFVARSKLIKSPQYLLELEQKYTDFLLSIVMEVAEKINVDFSHNSFQLLPFWRNYPPEQRGRQPTGTAVPLLELGEKTLSSHLLAVLAHRLLQIKFPGLPIGGDIRFSTNDAFIHWDIKLTGPNDNPHELVVPPNQVSGDGIKWENEGVINSTWPVYYQTGAKKGEVNYYFQPKLPPFYILDGEVLPCLTFFLKAVYTVDGLGIQPLHYFELACVPNGLLMFENAQYAQTSGLIIAGKDDKTKAEDTMRIRIRLDPLAKLHEWRAIKILSTQHGWESKNRSLDL